MPVTYTDSVSAEIRAEMGRQALNQRTLAARLGWTQQMLSRRLVSQVPWSTKDIEQLADALRIPISQLASPRQVAS